MWKLLNEIQGMQVVSLEEGRILGSVQKVFLNPSKKAVSGVLVRPSGLSRDEGWIDIKDVTKIGEDVLFISKARAFKAKAPVGRSLKDLMGIPVTSKDGKLLGSLVDVEIDNQWQVVELSISEGRMITIDPKHAVFGPDAILLKAGADKRVRSAVKPKPGFLARLFGAEVIEEAADAIARVERIRNPEHGTKTKTRPKKTGKAARKSSKKKRN